jgi:hypothetical protein
MGAYRFVVGTMHPLPLHYGPGGGGEWGGAFAMQDMAPQASSSKPRGSERSELVTLCLISQKNKAVTFLDLSPPVVALACNAVVPYTFLLTT